MHQLFPNKEIRVVPNAKGNISRYFYGKRLFVITMSTNNEYRITFCSNQEKAFPLIVEYPGTIVKATSPKGEQWFRLVNKGELDEKLIKNIVKNSIAYYDEIDAEKQRLIEEEKARKQAEKDALVQSISDNLRGE